MSANRARNSKPELILRKSLWKNGLRGYRLHYKKIPGRPDISFVLKKVAIFVHGCYWHRCPECNYSIPKTNQTFWADKFSKNKARDSRKVNELQQLGWTVVIVRECELKMRAESVIKSISDIKTKETFSPRSGGLNLAVVFQPTVIGNKNATRRVATAWKYGKHIFTKFLPSRVQYKKPRGFHPA